MYGYYREKLRINHFWERVDRAVIKPIMVDVSRCKVTGASKVIWRDPRHKIVTTNQTWTKLKDNLVIREIQGKFFDCMLF